MCEFLVNDAEALLQEAPVGLVLVYRDGGAYVTYNKEYKRIIGYPIERAGKLSYWKITPEKWGGKEKELLQSIDQHGSYGPYYKQYIHRTKGLVPVRLLLKYVELKGQKYIWSAVDSLGDVPDFCYAGDKAVDEEWTEKDLAEIPEFPPEDCRLLLDDAPIGLALSACDDGRFFYANKEFASIVGRRIEELRGLTYRHLTPRKYCQKRHEFMERLKCQQIVGPDVIQLINPTKGLVPVLVRARCLAFKGCDCVIHAVDELADVPEQEMVIDPKRLEQAVDVLNNSGFPDFAGLLSDCVTGGIANLDKPFADKPLD